MLNKTHKQTFDQRMQSRIESFRAAGGYSVERFVDLYEETYKEMFAAERCNKGRSTLRKLVNEQPHHYTVKEVEDGQVLEVLKELLGLDILTEEFWEEQQLQAGKHLERDVRSSAKEEKVATKEHKQKAPGVAGLTASDPVNLESLAQFIKAQNEEDSLLPLVVLCDEAEIARYIIRSRFARSKRLSPEQLKTDGVALPNRLVYTSITASPMSAELGRCIDDANRVMREAHELGRKKFVVIIAETSDFQAFHDARTELEGVCTMVLLRWNNMVLQEWMNIENKCGRMHPIMAKCLTEVQMTADKVSMPRTTFSSLSRLSKSLHACKELVGEDLMLALIRRGVHIEHFGFMLWLFEQNHPELTEEQWEEKDQLFQQLIARTQDERLCWTDIWKTVYPQACAILRQHGWPRGWEKCDTNALLQALEVVPLLLDDQIWPKQFCREINSWLLRGNVELLQMRSEEEWVAFLNEEFTRQREWLDPNGEWAESYDFFCRHGWPKYWFSAHADQRMYLSAIQAYLQWRQTSKADEACKQKVHNAFMKELYTKELKNIGTTDWQAKLEELSRTQQALLKEKQLSHLLNGEEE